MSKTLKFSQALLRQGWANNVSIEVDSAGVIVAIESDATGSDFLSGAAVPGMVNLHSHAHQRAMAGLAERSGNNHSNGGDSFWTWRNTMYQFLDQIKPEQLHAIASQLYIEMLKAGYTRVAEFQYLHHQPNGQAYRQLAEMCSQTIEAASSTGLGICCLPVLYHQGGFNGQALNQQQARFGNNVEQYLRLLEHVNADASAVPNSNVGIAAHSLRAVSKESFNDVLSSNVLEQGNRPIHIHIAEQLKEVADCQQWSGRRPVEYLFESFDVNQNWCLIHATHLNEAEIKMIAESKAVVGLCPTTEANLGDGIFPAKSFLDLGGKIGIGSDSHISVSVNEELRWLEYGQRLLNHSRNHLAGAENTSTGRTLFDHAVQGGAQASGFNSGELAVGKLADIVVLDTDHPLLVERTEDEILDGWIFSGNQNTVKDVYVTGRKVIQNGQHFQQQLVAQNFQSTIKQLRA